MSCLASGIAWLARKGWWPLEGINTAPLLGCLPSRLGVVSTDCLLAPDLMVMNSVLASLHADVVLTLALGIAEMG